MKRIDKRTHKDRTVSYRARVRIKGHPVLIQSFSSKTLAIKKHQHIIHSMRNPSNLLIFPNKEEIKLEPYLCVNDSKTMIKAHYSLVKELLNQKKLIEVLPSYVEREIPLYVAFPHRRYVPSKIGHFVDFILTKLGSDII